MYGNSPFQVLLETVRFSLMFKQVGKNFYKDSFWEWRMFKNYDKKFIKFHYKNFVVKKIHVNKRIESLPQIQIFLSLYLCKNLPTILHSQFNCHTLPVSPFKFQLFRVVSRHFCRKYIIPSEFEPESATSGISKV